MPRFLPALLAITLLFTGCAIHHRDRELLQDHGVSGALYSKMLHHEPLELDEIIELSQKKVPGPFIVYYLRPTYYVYKLSPSDVDRLRKAGVEPGVIGYLQATPGMFSPQAAPPWYSEDPRFGGYYQSGPPNFY